MQINKLRVAKSDIVANGKATVVNLVTPGAMNVVDLVVEDIDDYMVFRFIGSSEEMLNMLFIAAVELSNSEYNGDPKEYGCREAKYFAKWANMTRSVGDHYVIGREDAVELLLKSEAVQGIVNAHLKEAGYDVTGIGHGIPNLTGHFFAPDPSSLNCGGKVSGYVPNPNFTPPFPGIDPVGAEDKGMSAGWIFAGVAATAAAGAGLYYLTKRGRK